jgi:phospholipid-binding lipoprotein MlaA
MQSSLSRLPLALALVAATAIAGPCRAADPSDPLEGMNRRFFAVQEALDRHVVGPLAHGFGAAPSPLRRALRNFGRNLNEPIVVVNDLLQGRVKQAVGAAARIVINTTLGIGGLLDVAKKNHLPHHDNSFGTTLGRWGAGPGPYLFIPLVGPTTLRDAFGSVADIGLNPLTYVRYRSKTEIGLGVVIIQGLGDRLEGERDLEVIRETSTDPYATLRSYYLQNRQAEITGKPADIEALPDLEPPEATPPKAAGPAEPSPSPPAAPAEPTSPRSDEATPGPEAADPALS